MILDSEKQAVNMANKCKEFQLVKAAKSRVEEIAEDLAIRIIRGEYHQGMNLPTIRELAASYQAPVSTLQRVIVWLESKLLISVKQGSGIKVRDPRWADASIVPLWIEALRNEPETAGKILGDFLALRRTMAIDLILNIRSKLNNENRQTVKELIEQFSTELDKAEPDPNKLIHYDTSLGEYLIEIYDQRAYFQVYSTFKKCLETNDGLVQAMYFQIGTKSVGMGIGMRLFGQYLNDASMSGQVFSKQVETLLTMYDKNICDYLIDYLKQENKSH